jgi:hypothetical protein
MASILKLKDFDQILVVEGYSDLLFYAEVLEHLGFEKAVYIKSFNGKEDLITKLEDFVTPQLLSEKRRIAIIVDADGDATGAFDQVRNALENLTGQNVAAPANWTNGQPQIGVFVTPDGVSNGEIETLVCRSWSEDATNGAERACIENFVGCMAENGHVAHSPDKGFISALLAIRYDEDPRLGPGARANVFDFSRPEFDQLRSFLSRFGA